MMTRTKAWLYCKMVIYNKEKNKCNTICFTQNSKLDHKGRELVLQDRQRKFGFSAHVSMLHFDVIFSSIFFLRIALNKKSNFLLLILLYKDDSERLGLV